MAYPEYQYSPRHIPFPVFYLLLGIVLSAALPIIVMLQDAGKHAGG